MDSCEKKGDWFKCFFRFKRGNFHANDWRGRGGFRGGGRVSAKNGGRFQSRGGGGSDFRRRRGAFGSSGSAGNLISLQKCVKEKFFMIKPLMVAILYT